MQRPLSEKADNLGHTKGVFFQLVCPGKWRYDNQ